jgi:hypothetical protein
MAAIPIHIVRVGFFSISKKTNLPINKEDPNTTINDALKTEQKHVVIPDTSIPNSAGYPTVDVYLKLEAAAGFKLQYMDQNMVVTYG